MALKLFEIVEQFMMDKLMLKITQFEKTGSNVKFNAAGKPENSNPLPKLELKHFFRDLYNFAVR